MNKLIIPNTFSFVVDVFFFKLKSMKYLLNNFNDIISSVMLQRRNYKNVKYPL